MTVLYLPEALAAMLRAYADEIEGERPDVASACRRAAVLLDGVAGE